MDSTNVNNFYSVLGTDQTASKQEIRKCYQSMALKHHPDKNLETDGASSNTFPEIAEAWKVLSDEQSRKEYDAQLKAQEMSAEYSVSESVSLNDMKFDQGDNMYYYPCRCGGEYLLLADEIQSEDASISINCDTCSLHVLIKCKKSDHTTEGNKES